MYEREKELGAVFTLLGGDGYYSFQYVVCSGLSLLGIPAPTMLNPVTSHCSRRLCSVFFLSLRISVGVFPTALPSWAIGLSACEAFSAGFELAFLSVYQHRPEIPEGNRSVVCLFVCLLVSTEPSRLSLKLPLRCLRRHPSQPSCHIPAPRAELALLSHSPHPLGFHQCPTCDTSAVSLTD